MSERARSFGAVAATYARYRPGYPAAALEWALAPAPGGEVLDLGAGTGKVTEALLRRPGVRVTAVDPDAAMLAQFRADFPTVDAHEGTAERIPLPDAAVDAVVIGTAWHWFDRALAEPEIARVLRPGGVLVVLWNGDDDTVEWVRGYHRALHPEEQAPIGTTISAAQPSDPAFEASETRRFANPVPTTIDGFVETISTHSWALIAEPHERDASLARMRDYLVARPETSPGAFTLPMVTDVVRTLRR
jgi:ubiquinone/menaquinone biosynthesis C-methylase UbiE